MMTQPCVLVVEDENLVALDICRKLQRYGYTVGGPVASGEEAIKQVSALRPDVVLMDVVLKGPLDGVTAAAQIRDTSDASIIFLTAHADESTLERAKITEPHGYLLKPFDETELRAALEMTLYQRLTRNDAFDSGLRGNIACKPLRFDDKDFLRTLDFFSDLPIDALTFFANSCERRSVPAGTNLVSDSKNPTVPAFIVRSGRIAIIEPSENSKELTTELVSPGDLFGLIMALERCEVPFVARADRDSELLLIPKRTFSLILEAHPALAIRFLRYVSSKLRVSQSLAKAIAYDDVFTRVATLLLTLIPRIGQRVDDSQAYTLDITRQELASLVGTTPETAVRVLKTMERMGVVKLGRRSQIEVCSPERLLQLRHQQEVSRCLN